MSFYLDRLEAARRQHRMMAEAAAAAVCAPPPPPRASPYYYHYQHAALLPRSPTTLPVPPLHAGEGGVGYERSGGRDAWRGGSVPRREAGPVGAGGLAGNCVRGVAGSVAPAREEAGGVGGREDREARSKRCLVVAPTPDARCPPPKRRAVPARRRFPPGCGRDDDAAAAPLIPRGDGGGGPGALQDSPPPTPLAGGKNSGQFDFEAAASPGSAAAGGGGGGGSSAFSNDDTAPQGGVAGPAGSGDQLLKSKDNLTPSSVRLLPKPTMVSAYRRFPPGCQRRGGAPLLAGGGGTQVWSPPPSEEAVAVRPVPQDRDELETVDPLCTADHGPAQSELEEGEVASEVQECPSAATQHDEATACRHGASSSDEEMTGNTWQGEENKSGGSENSCNNVVAESLAQGLLPNEHLNGESVSECASMDTASSGAADGVSNEEGDTFRKKKIMFTPRKSVKSPKLIQKQPALNTQRRLFSRETWKETEIARRTTNSIFSEDTDEFTKDQAVQDPIPRSADKCPWTKGKDAATVSGYFGPKKKKKMMMNDKEDYSNLLDDDILKAIAVDHEGKFEHGHQDADASRSKVKTLCSRFESICRAIVQSAEQRSLKVRRIDLAADKLIRKLPGFTKLGPIVGAVPGVEVGDEFLYRVQLALVGLHRPYQGGIDTTKDERGVLIAISVVASGGYPDELSSPGELIYTGSGKDGWDQKLEHGNLALRNCVERKVPVRVIHGFKGLNREGGSHSRAKETTTFTYDGLYRVVDCWKEGRPGSKVFKYKLKRIPGQPGLPLHVAKFARKNNI